MDAAHRSCPETDVTGMVGDVHRAVAWIKANAAQYGIDSGRVVVMGGSSGAHIALLAAYAPDEPRLIPEDVVRIPALVGPGRGLATPAPRGSGRSRASSPTPCTRSCWVDHSRRCSCRRHRPSVN
ncbi:alpha/beta hydrolase fold domain-containing protein (plasmid) [Rhodococcus sp. DMU1]|nr:alpha/beta hydrolase fold domain-containing protein [Rhodococcus sp. DMU1]